MRKYKKEMEEALRGDDIDPIESEIGRECMDIAKCADFNIKEQKKEIKRLRQIFERIKKECEEDPWLGYHDTMIERCNEALKCK